MYNENIEFRPGTVVPVTSDPEASRTFTVRDQYDRVWNAENNINPSHVYVSAWDATSAMRKFCESKAQPNMSETEAQKAIARKEIARRMEFARLALRSVDFEFRFRNGQISMDTMRSVQRAIDLLK